MSAQLAQIIAQCGGHATRDQIGKAVPNRLVTKAVREGEIVRLRRGLYTLPGLSAAVQGAQRTSGVVSHRSAAMLHGWGVLHEPKRPEIIVARQLRVAASRRTGLDLRYRTLDAGDIADGVTSPARTVIDCARDLDLPEALAVADSALRSGKVTQQEMLDALSDAPRTGRMKAERVLRLASLEADNPFESGLRGLAFEAVDRPWVPQATVTLRDGLELHADVGDPGLRIALEADSHEFHKSRADVRRDCHRYTEMVIARWVVLRFAWEHVMFNPDWVREVIAWVVRQRAGTSRASSRSA